MPFTTSLRVRYAEVDSQGVVFNANWLLYADEAMTRFVEHLGFEPALLWAGDDEDGRPSWDFMVRAARVDFAGSARFEDVVDIEVTATRLGRTSFDVRFRCCVGDRTAVTVDSTYVVVTHGALTPLEIPDDLRAGLTAALSDPTTSA